jgi:uncharacterized membrane protein (UPF0127 family)
MKRFSAALGLLLFLTPALAQVFPEASLTMGIYRIEAEVAATEETREQGLMFREKMAVNHGMVFVFPESHRECMWMKNTLIPLSVAFIDGRGRIVNIEDMDAKTLNNHCSTGRISYALEMNRDWFRQRGFKAGAQVLGLDQLPLPR